MKKFITCCIIVILCITSDTIFATIYTVTSTADAGAGTLRQCITDANATAVGAPHTINFNIAGVAPFTINLASDLPAITRAGTVIDATTQTGYSGTPIVYLNATGRTNGIYINNVASVKIFGLQIYGATNGININGDAADGFQIGDANKGNYINRSIYHINISDADNGFIYGNKIGLNIAGTAVYANGSTSYFYGIYLTGNTGTCNGNTIGGASAGQGNIICGVEYDGLRFNNSGVGRGCNNNFVRGNIFGTDATLTKYFWCGYGAVRVTSNCASNTIGGTLSGEGNVISNNAKNAGGGASAILIYGPNSDFNQIRRNTFYCNQENIQVTMGINLCSGCPAGNGGVATTVLSIAGNVVSGTGAGNGSTVELYYDGNCKYCQGSIYVASATADALGNWSIDLSSLNLPPCPKLTATTTHTNGNTSEFSNCVNYSNNGVRWTGVTSTEWNLAANWDCGSVPNSTLDAWVPNVTRASNRFPVIGVGGALTANVKSLRVDTLASINLNTAGDILQVYDDWDFRNGSVLTSLTTSNIRFLSNIAGNKQNFSHNGSGTLPNTTINQGVNAPGMVLLTDMSVNASSTLTFTNGIIDGFTNNKKVILNNTAGTSCNAGSTSSYVQGILEHVVGTTTNTFNFPVGTVLKGYQLSTLNFTIAPTSSSTIDAYFQNTISGITQTICTNNYQSHLDNGQWDISRIAGTGGTYRVTLYNTAGSYTTTGTLFALSKDAVIPATLNCGTEQFITPNSVTCGGLTTFSKFATATNQAPLPVKLLFFNAFLNKQDKNILLSWSTASETNNDYFTIEKSLDAINWELLGFVDGAGNSNQVLNYKYTDYKPIIGNQFYRLKQTDYNGNFEYSAVATISNNENADFECIIYPNPNQGKFELFIRGDANASTSLKIVNILGHNVGNYPELTGNVFSFDITESKAGIYYIEIIQNNNFKIIKIIKN